MKLYVLVREDLSHAQRAVQGGHAIAEFCKYYPYSEWKQRSLVFLGVKDENQLRLWMNTFGEMAVDNKQIEMAEFLEPWWDNSLTAFAILGTQEVCETVKELQLI